MPYRQLKFPTDGNQQFQKIFRQSSSFKMPLGTKQEQKPVKLHSAPGIAHFLPQNPLITLTAIVFLSTRVKLVHRETNRENTRKTNLILLWHIKARNSERLPSLSVRIWSRSDETVLPFEQWLKEAAIAAGGRAVNIGCGGNAGLMARVSIHFCSRAAAALLRCASIPTYCCRRNEWVAVAMSFNYVRNLYFRSPSIFRAADLVLPRLRRWEVENCPVQYRNAVLCHRAANFINS